MTIGETLLIAVLAFLMGLIIGAVILVVLAIWTAKKGDEIQTKVDSIDIQV